MLGFNPEGKKFLIQSPSPDWIRRKIFLRDLRDSAVNLIFPSFHLNPREIPYQTAATDS
jgi:hypothetical protein